jgi:hypothetical protein
VKHSQDCSWLKTGRWTWVPRAWLRTEVIHIYATIGETKHISPEAKGGRVALHFIVAISASFK